MKHVIATLSLFLLLVVQTGILAQLGLGAVGNLMLLFTLMAVVSSDVQEGLITAIIAGVMLDLASGSRDGTLLICFLACFGFTYAYIYKFVPRDTNRLILLSCVAINTVLFAIVFVFVNKFLVVLGLDTLVDWKFVLGKKLIIDLVINVIFAYPIFVYFSYIKKLERRFSIA